MQKPRIHAADPADAASLAAIDRECFRPAIAFAEAEILDYLETPGVTALVAETDAGIVGFVIAEPKSARTADIVTLDVRPAWRRRRIASELFARVEAVLESRGTRRCRLQVDTGNTGALEFYRRRGYRLVRTLPGYYPDGADAFLMEKDLGGGPASNPDGAADGRSGGRGR